jgi:hypothetical protein
VGGGGRGGGRAALETTRYSSGGARQGISDRENNAGGSDGEHNDCGERLCRYVQLGHRSGETLFRSFRLSFRKGFQKGVGKGVVSEEVCEMDGRPVTRPSRVSDTSSGARWGVGAGGKAVSYF